MCEKTKVEDQKRTEGVPLYKQRGLFVENVIFLYDFKITVKKFKMKIKKIGAQYLLL